METWTFRSNFLEPSTLCLVDPLVLRNPYLVGLETFTFSKGETELSYEMLRIASHLFPPNGLHKLNLKVTENFLYKNRTHSGLSPLDMDVNLLCVLRKNGRPDRYQVEMVSGVSIEDGDLFR